MAVLVFFKNNQELMKYVLRQDKTSVGRSSSSDICLPDTNVSRTHFTISLVNGKFLIVDRSTNGTVVGNQNIVSHELRDEDKIKIGDWEIVFRSGDEPSTKVMTSIPGRDATEILAFDPEKRELRCRAVYVEPVGRKKDTFRVRGDITSIGKSESNDICLADDKFVSNFHCKIENRRGTFFIKDLGSTNGTFLNDQQIVEASIPGDALITVGQSKFKIHFKEEEEKLKPFAGKEFHQMIGGTSSMRQIYSLVSRIAASDTTVLVHGETGVGKEMVARAIHELSPRSDKSFITLNCSAIAKELIESELFGHEKGAFTSAHQSRQGAFEAAHGGTLFLDEIGDMPLDLQPKLLRALENREIKRVGSNSLIDIDVRIVAATNRSLADLVSEGKFREDLYYRLYVVPVHIPPLRERVDDIQLLANHFLDHASAKSNKPKRFSPAAMEALVSFGWPGNVRELKNLISRTLLNVDGDEIDLAHLNFAPTTLKEQTKFEGKKGGGAMQPPKTLRELEKERILEELMRNNWNKKKTAETLGIAKTTLFEKIKKYGLKPQ